MVPELTPGSRVAQALLRHRLGEFTWRLFCQTNRLMRPSKLWPGVEYMISAGNPVSVLKDGQLVAKLCVLAARQEPEADRLMTILDLIETDERQLWEMGTVTNFGLINFRPFRVWSGTEFRGAVLGFSVAIALGTTVAILVWRLYLAG